MVGSLSLRDGGVGRPSWRGGRPSRKARMGREALPEGREGLGVPSAGSGGDTMTSRRTGRERDTLPRGWEGSGGPPKVLRGVGRPSQRDDRGWDTLPGDLKESGGPLGGRKTIPEGG